MINTECINFKFVLNCFVANHVRWAILNLFFGPNNHLRNATSINASILIINIAVENLTGSDSFELEQRLGREQKRKLLQERIDTAYTDKMR